MPERYQPHSKRLIARLIFLAIICYGCVLEAAQYRHLSEPVDGRWQLKISGNSLFFYGTSLLTAGLKQPWIIDITFEVRNGQFNIGSGKGRLVGNPQPFSKPEGMFTCHVTNGTYLDRSLELVNTPHMRYAGFPITGQLVGRQITLKPELHYIANFLAMMYRCETSSMLGSVWLERGKLSSIERNKRQGANKSVKNGTYAVDIKEMQMIEPRGLIELPLTDGLKIKRHDQASFGTVIYELRRL